MAENRFAKYKQQGGNRFAKYATQQAAPAEQPQQPLAWSDVPGKAWENLPNSAYNFAAGIGNAVMHPIDTIDNLGQVAAGGIANGLSYIPGMEYASQGPMQDKARAVGNFYADRYGSVEGLKNTLATDPVGAAADASTVLLGGEAAAARIPGVAKAAPLLGAAGDAINPVSLPAKVARPLLKGAGEAAKPLLGVTTGTSAETIDTAYKAGKAGGNRSTAFKDNLRGNVDQAAVVDEAKQALDRIAEQRSTAYKTDIKATQADAANISFKPIQDAYSKLIDSMYYEAPSGKTIRQASDKTMAKIEELGNILIEWERSPDFHNAGGLDALKKRIDEAMPTITEANRSDRAVAAVSELRNAVKDLIVQQSPQYAKTMKNYEESKAAQNEIERALSLKKNNAADTALRKLQSITRNNAQTNYGSRAKALDVLKEAGAETLPDALAGQALSANFPRGLTGGVMAGSALAAGQYLNPLFALSLAATSPRLIGEASHALGSLQRRFGQMVPPNSIPRALLLGGQSNNGGLLNRQ
jgi:hypothetical protein